MTTAEITIERDASTRQRRLAESVRALRTRAGGADGAKPLLIIGGILIPLGFVLVLLGWAGASNTVNSWEQIPYLISGGLLGLGLIFAGGFTYFAYWLTQLVYAARRDAADTRVILERIEALIATGASLSAVAPATASPVGAAGDRTGSSSVRTAPLVSHETYLATATGTMFHRPDCPAVSGRDNLREVTPDDGLTPCRICDPV